MIGSNRRVSRGRSRGGCLTCKIRRVKCDEAKPACQKCHSTGRKCDYLTDPPKLDSQDAQIVHHIPDIAKRIKFWGIPQSKRSIKEPACRSLEFFQLHTTFCFGKDIGLHLLRAVYHEPIIQNIAIAIGSLHRSFEHNEKSMITQEETRFSMQHYNKAIRQLVALDHRTLQSRDTFLIACILFYSFECLQGHYSMAVQHGTSGLKIMKQQQQMAAGQNLPAYMPHETMTQLFAILEYQIIELQGEVPLADELRPTLFSSFLTPTFDPSHPPSNAEEMQTCFELLYNRLTRFLSICEDLEQPYNGLAFEFVAHVHHLQEEHVRVRTDLEAWIVAFDSWRDAGWAETCEKSDNIQILEIWKATIRLMLGLEWPMSELSWDEQIEDFTLIISLVSEMLGFPALHSEKDISAPPHLNILSMQGSMSSLPPLRPKPIKVPATTFSMSLGVITPLYLCATRCRDSYVRRRAIDILSTCKRREGLWDSELTARITRRIVEIEENGAGIQPGARYKPSDIGIAFRVQSLTPQYEQERHAKVRYHMVCRDTYPIEEKFTW